MLAIEALTAARALDCLRPLRSSLVIERFRTDLRKPAPEWNEDQPLAGQIRAVSEFIKDGVRRDLNY